ncbi:GMC family oxidoreductase [Luethyella okanaganae]|uniref:GMC family oxidoreductase n=1 Tax=Luethyella okanaganae TaxID=69372 RepID=A0ABW1VKH4_9MICO
MGSRVIVVGAGSAGCAVAGRLAERGSTVDLIEAGPDWRSESCDDEIRRPSDDIFAWRVDGRAASRFAFPDVTATRFDGRDALPYLRGWGMGGTSSLNGLVVVRPPDDEFDHWTELGCAGWGPHDVLPAFIRLEDDLDYGAAPYHGRGGPTPVVRRGEHEWGSGDRLLAHGAAAAGHDWAPDYNRPGALGVSRTASNIRLGVRVTSYDGYVEPWREDGRIVVHADRLVARVIVRDNRAVGVELRAPDGTVQVVEADQVVLAAGAAATPGLLERSGIGSDQLLARLGIAQHASLPVGEGIQDHVGFWLSAGLDSAQPAANGARGNVTLRYSSGLAHSRSGDLLVVAANPPSPDFREVAFGVKLGHCASRGSSHIVSDDPRVASGIRLNLLGDERDLATGRHALRTATALLSHGGRIVRDRNGEPVDARWDDATIDAWLLRCATDTSHLSGGAVMGADTDPGSVVDPRLRVHGIRGLTVADLSICPVVPRANTYLTSLMIGERAADFVTEELARPDGRR